MGIFNGEGFSFLPVDQFSDRERRVGIQAARRFEASDRKITWVNQKSIDAWIEGHPVVFKSGPTVYPRIDDNGVLLEPYNKNSKRTPPPAPVPKRKREPETPIPPRSSRKTSAVSSETPSPRKPVVESSTVPPTPSPRGARKREPEVLVPPRSTRKASGSSSSPMKSGPEAGPSSSSSPSKPRSSLVGPQDALIPKARARANALIRKLADVADKVREARSEEETLTGKLFGADLPGVDKAVSLEEAALEREDGERLVVFLRDV